MIRLMCFGLWSMLLQTGAQAEWVELDQNETAAFSYDPSLIETLPDGKVSAWIKVGATPKSELTQIWEAAEYGPYPYSLSRRIFDCSTWQSATSSVRYYTTDGKKISEENHSSWEFKDILPGTVGNRLANLICKKRINKNNATSSPSVEEQVAQAKNNNSYLVHWENNDPAA